MWKKAQRTPRSILRNKCLDYSGQRKDFSRLRFNLTSTDNELSDSAASDKEIPLQNTKPNTRSDSKRYNVNTDRSFLGQNVQGRAENAPKAQKPQKQKRRY